jgi:hypothetical protein
MEFSRLEKAAIAAILSQHVASMEIVCTQFAAASVVKRDYSSVGFFTEISVPPSVPALPSSKELRDALFYGAMGRAKSDPEGWVHFMLWTDEGYLACLEGYTFRDAWPNEDEIEGIQPPSADSA